MGQQLNVVLAAELLQRRRHNTACAQIDLSNRRLDGARPMQFGQRVQVQISDAQLADFLLFRVVFQGRPEIFQIANGQMKLIAAP